MRRLLILAMALSPGWGCERNAAQSTAAPDAAPVAAPSPSAKSPWSDHEHETAHGGRVRTAGDGHLELKLEADGRVTIWLLDGQRHALTAKGAKGTLHVAKDDKDIPLTYDADADALKAKLGEMQPGLPVVFDVNITRAEGASMTAKFNVAPTS